MTNEMPVPAWAEDQRVKMLEMMASTKITEVDLNPNRLCLVEGYSTHFLEFDARDDDFIIHVFPRGGADDRYFPGEYVNKCRNCGSEVPSPKTMTAVNPCPKCGHTGLKYVPGRLETKNNLKFPDGIEKMIEESIGKAWLGDYVLEFVPELNSYAIQIKNIKNTVSLVGVDDFMLKICEHLDLLLEK
jgi:DNA-directed RNA polymerase subunit RPC12/RpoP